MDIYQHLSEHDVSYQRFDHPPVYTCDEAKRLAPDMPGANTKNLFLRDNKGKRHFLVLVDYEKTVDLKQLSKVLGVSGLSLASAERLSKHLGVEPGSVSILAALNDSQGAVQVVVDKQLWLEDSFCCHPLVNTSTLVISRADIEKLLHVSGHQPQIVSVPDKMS